jgi:hypothetical protein
MTWKNFQVRELTDTNTDEEKEIFFAKCRENTFEKGIISSKIIGVNAREVFLLGGDNNEGSLLTREYSESRTCFKIDIISG